MSRLQVGVAMGLAALTLMRVAVWRSELTLWRDAVRGSHQGTVRAWANLSRAELFESGDVVAAITACRSAHLVPRRLAREDEWRFLELLCPTPRRSASCCS